MSVSLSASGGLWGVMHAILYDHDPIFAAVLVPDCQKLPPPSPGPEAWVKDDQKNSNDNQPSGYDVWYSSGPRNGIDSSHYPFHFVWAMATDSLGLSHCSLGSEKQQRNTQATINYQQMARGSRRRTVGGVLLKM